MTRRRFPLGLFITLGIVIIAAVSGVGLLSETSLAARFAQDAPVSLKILSVVVGVLGSAVMLALAVHVIRIRRREAEIAEAKLASLLEASPNGIVVFDRKFRIVLVNSQVEKMFGYPRSELLGQSIELLVPRNFRELFGDSAVKEQAPPTSPPLGKRGQEGVPSQGKGGQRGVTEPLVGRRKDGSGLPVEIHFRPMQSEEGLAITCVIRDVTEQRQAEASRRQAEESLRQAETKYRSIFENAAEGIFQVTPEGRFLTANPALARMLGYRSPEELMDMVTDVKKQLFVEPGKRSEIRKLAESSGLARGFEYQAYRKDGSKIWLLGNQRVVRDENDQVLYFEGNFEEITVRKRAEDALRESQRALLTLMSNLPGMAYRCRNDRDRTLEFASEGSHELTGYPPSDLVGNRKVTFGHLIHLDDRDMVYKTIQTALVEDKPYQLQYRIQISGREKVVWEQGRGVRLPEDGKLELEGLLIDITERVRAQEGMRKSEERFRLLAENIHGVFWMTDPRMKELFYVSSAYEEIWGASRASLYKNPLSRLEAIDSVDRERVLAACSRAEGYDEEYRITRSDGSARWIWDRAFPIADEKGQVYRLAGIAEDITERKRLEEALLQAQKMEAVGRLAGGIAHDFNNLLTVIKGYGDIMLAELPETDPNREYVQDISKAAEQAASLTRQLLAFSRKQMLIPEVLGLNNLLTTMKELVQRLIGEDIDFELRLDPALGPVEADPGQLQQVVMNLAVNARDAMPKGGKLVIETANVDVSEHAVAECKPGPYAKLTVRDTGCGMDAATRSHLFEPFFTTKEVGKGTGLGLSTVYGIIRQSNGGIQVDSAPDKGSTFHIYLPRVADAVLRAQPAKTRDQTSRGHETILLVEDEEMVRGMARRLLQKKGYTVLEAGQPLEALQLAEKHAGKIDLLVSDVVMPKMNGRELQQRLSKVRPDMKVMFMSGYTDSALLRHGILAESLMILLKPFTPEDFLHSVREVLDQVPSD